MKFLENNTYVFSILRVRHLQHNICSRNTKKLKTWVQELWPHCSKMGFWWIFVVTSVLYRITFWLCINSPSFGQWMTLKLQLRPYWVQELDIDRKYPLLAPSSVQDDRKWTTVCVSSFHFTVWYRGRFCAQYILAWKCLLVKIQFSVHFTCYEYAG